MEHESYDGRPITCVCGEVEIELRPHAFLPYYGAFVLDVQIAEPRSLVHVGATHYARAALLHFLERERTSLTDALASTAHYMVRTRGEFDAHGLPVVELSDDEQHREAKVLDIILRSGL